LDLHLENVCGTLKKHITSSKKVPPFSLSELKHMLDPMAVPGVVSISEYMDIGGLLGDRKCWGPFGLTEDLRGASSSIPLTSFNASMIADGETPCAESLENLVLD
jgi:hypothetical protein